VNRLLLDNLKIRGWILVALAAIFILASGSQAEAQGPVSAGALAHGQVIEKVICTDDPAESYALYLPSTYTNTRRWPVLFAFDPGARGKLPVERFKEGAERFGWIVIGSNNSRNGPFQPSLDAWKAILKDSRNRLAIDDARAYLTGLSGGARLSIYLASHCQDCIVGVIACAAGFPLDVTPSNALHFLYYGTTGVDDFNFPEVKGLEEPLTRAGMTHQIEVFIGRHEWPPAEVAANAIEWMELQAMRSGGRPKDSPLIESSWNRKLQQAKLAEESHKLFEAYQFYSALSSTFKDLTDVIQVENKVRELRDASEIKTAIRDEERQINKQRETEGRLRQLIASSQRVSLGNSGSDPGNDDERHRATATDDVGAEMQLRT
jgi:predicted esterase